MKEIIDFLTELKQNNNREWYELNKPRYKAVQARVLDFAQQLINGIAEFDSTIKGVTVKDCTYRIYRDVRFSPNKEPYKTHIGIYVCQGGKKSGYSGYYCHFEPENSIVCAGLNCPEKDILRSVRDEVEDNGMEFLESIKKADGFILDQRCRLQRVPKGFPADSEYAEFLKLKEFDIIKPLTVDDNGLLDRILKDFRSAKDFNDILNRAVRYAMEERTSR